MEIFFIDNGNYIDELKDKMKLTPKQKAMIDSATKPIKIISETYGYVVSGYKEGFIEDMVKNNGFSNHILMDDGERRRVNIEFLESKSFTKAKLRQFKYTKFILISQQALEYFIRKKLGLS